MISKFQSFFIRRKMLFFRFQGVIPFFIFSVGRPATQKCFYHGKRRKGILQYFKCFLIKTVNKGKQSESQELGRGQAK